ncbi:DUF1707 domain-containing protein [Gordonia desulfuricans]|uniref:DUF1707 domain-containing protein n=1 Tax=Gordonia desulfuricans TaxID=89051 RepID=A0A7K3LKL0_9ACTN|nr:MULTISPECIES: DUF1707 domain-containing protein [Gordonia]KOY49744.1 hypothetical protein ISGA_08185 [Gordonia sp. NB41Y]NDK88693.1 DUF1707 domain-containing protein [Gordonia desulfuricans]WLP91886.1 DUF1707 domain-containing protein [Gordonia sp. NB41Y]
MTSAPEPPASDDGHSRMRAADADRELVQQILAAALTGGHLTAAEYEQRSGRAVLAKTFGDLDTLTDDLPVTQLGVALPQPGDPYPSRVSSGSGREPIRSRLAILSGSELTGAVPVAEHLSATAILGGVEIDLREVEFTAPHLTIQCLAIMGGIDIVVPPDVAVEIGGGAIMGGFGGGKAAGPGTPGAPTVHITGFAVMGGVEVKRKERGVGGWAQRWGWS